MPLVKLCSHRLFCKLLLVAVTLVLGGGIEVRAALVPVDLTQFAFAPDREAKVSFSGAPAPDKALKYQISDYWEAPVLSAEGKVDHEGKVDVTLKLKPGFYEITFPETGQTFGLLSMAAFEGKADSFFSMDTSLSWLAPVPMREALIKLLKRSGIAMARERLSWPQINPSPDRWDWESPRQFEKTRATYAANGVQVLELFHSAPAWAHPQKGNGFPEDLIGTARSWETIGERWHSQWGGLEVWNEPDIQSAADQYLPILKTVRYALRANKIDVPIGGGVFAYLNRPFLNLAARNGMLDEVDFVSFHYYGQPLGLEKHIAEFRSWLKDFGREAMPLWITEIGAPWEGTAGKRPTAAQGTGHALDFAANAMEARACGIARLFPFVYVNYAEKGTRNYGMMDAQGAPLRAMAAYANAVRNLAGASYVGDLRLSDPAIKRARVFDRSGPGADGKAVVLLYTAQAGKGLAVQLPFKAVRATGVDGRSLELQTGGKLLIPDGLAYVEAESSEIRPLLTRQTEAFRLLSIGRQPAAKPLAPSEIVLQPLPDPDFSENSRGYNVPEGTKQAVVRVRVNNLSGEPKVVDLDFHNALPSKTPAPSLHAERLSIAAKQSADVSASVDLSLLPSDAGGVSVLQIGATAKGVERIAPAALNFIVARGLAEHLQSHPYQFALPIAEAHRWEANIGGGGKMQLGKSDAGTWTIGVSFPQKGDRWAYPKFAIPQEVDLDRVEGILIRARCAKPGTVRILTFTAARKQFITGFPVIKADGEWHVAYVPLDTFMALPETAEGTLGRQISKLSVGLNSQAEENTLEISDLYFLGK